MACSTGHTVPRTARASALIASASVLPTVRSCAVRYSPIASPSRPRTLSIAGLRKLCDASAVWSVSDPQLYRTTGTALCTSTSQRTGKVSRSQTTFWVSGSEAADGPRYTVALHGSDEVLTPASGANLAMWSQRKSKFRLMSTPTQPPPFGRRFLRHSASVVWLCTRPSGLTHANTYRSSVCITRCTSAALNDAPP